MRRQRLALSMQDAHLTAMTEDEEQRIKRFVENSDAFLAANGRTIALVVVVALFLAWAL